MKRIALLLLSMLTSLSAAAQSPILRAHLEPSSGILVGQPVRLVVTVLVPNYFTGAPDLPEFEIENAIVVLPQETPQNSSEQVGAVSYAGITETYTIYPQQPGDFKLPPAKITAPYASAPPKTSQAQLTLPPLLFHAGIPDAAQSLDYFLPTTRLTLRQKWSAPLKNLRAGDSIERTITVTALNMQAMLIPPLPMNAPGGIRVYPEEPAVQDHKTSRNVFVFGQRTQSAQYLIQEKGDYTLPAITLWWWNLSTNRLVTATLPAVRFTAAGNANYQAGLPPEPEPIPVVQPKHISLWIRYKFWIQVVGPCCLVFLALLWIGWSFVPRVRRIIQARRKQRKHSEPAYFRNLQRACRRNHAMQAYQWLLKWLALTSSGATVHEFLIGTGDPALSSEINHLGASLFAESDRSRPWNGKRMALLLRQRRRTQITHATKRLNMLKLNP